MLHFQGPGVEHTNPQGKDLVVWCSGVMGFTHDTTTVLGASWW